MNDASVSSSLQLRPHPLSILSYLAKYLFLLLIPLLRGFLSALQGGLYHWLSSAWIDLLLVLGYLGLGVVIWLCYTLSPTPEGLYVRRGVFLREEYLLPRSRFSCITTVEPFYLKPFGGVFLRVDTPGGGLKQADLSVFLRKRDLPLLLKVSAPQQPPYLVRGYRPKSSYVFLLAALTSNSFAGVLLLSTLVSQIGEVLGHRFSEMLYGTFEEVARALAFGLPPAAAAIAYLLLFGYLLAFVSNLLRHGNFSVSRRGELLEIRSGLLTGRTYYLRRRQIGCVDIRRTLFTSILGLSSVFLQTVGYGKYDDDISALIPCTTRQHLESSLRLLLPEYHPSPRTVRPNWRSWGHYLYQGALLCGGVLLGAALSFWLFPTWQSLTFWVGLLCLIPSLWYTIVQLVDFFTAGLSFSQGCFTLRCAHRFYLHQVILPRERVASVRAVASLLQHRRGRCDLIVSIYSEGHRRYRVRDLSWSEVELLLQHAGMEGMAAAPQPKTTRYRPKLPSLLKKLYKQ